MIGMVHDEGTQPWDLNKRLPLAMTRRDDLDPQTPDFRDKTYPPVFPCEIQDRLKLILKSVP